MRTALALLVLLAACGDEGSPPLGSYDVTWSCDDACADPNGVFSRVEVSVVGGEASVVWRPPAPSGLAVSHNAEIDGACVVVADDDGWPHGYSLCSDTADTASGRVFANDTCGCTVTLTR